MSTVTFLCSSTKNLFVCYRFTFVLTKKRRLFLLLETVPALYSLPLSLPMSVKMLLFPFLPVMIGYLNSHWLTVLWFIVIIL
jgi:hypothetical protein